jgi:uncharacterized protein YjiS (DUF1127 family)
MAIIESTHRIGADLLFLTTRTPFQGIAGIRAIWREWQTRRRYRTDLNRLLRVGTYMVEDVGLTLAEVRREIEKPFWQA